MQLKEYQKNYTDKLLEEVKLLLAKGGDRICVFKAPTGSGKTIMIADFLQKLINEKLDIKLSFIWLSAHNLHKQSREKLEKYLKNTPFKFSYLEEVKDNTIKENEIIFVNWEEITKKDRKTGKFINVFMRDNEQNRNLPTFAKNTKEEGREIFLIIDESHYYYWSKDSQRLVNEIISPRITLEVSATPKIEPSPEEIANKEAGYISIKFEEVVDEGMVKKEIIINEEFGRVKVDNRTADEVVIETAIRKRERLKRLYEEMNININPLVLIQLPSQQCKTNSLDRTKIEIVKKILKDNFNITVENGKLGIWLSDQKKNLDNIEKLNNPVEVLIFKQAIAVGWDCPRAQILIMFREIQNFVFEIQTIGRIIRMPEARHYDIEELNKAYIFTNLATIKIKETEQGYFYRFITKRKQDYQNINLPSIYLHRVDYGDLTLSFREIFIKEANAYFNIKATDSPNEAIKKVNKRGVIINIDNLKEKVISEEKITDIDRIKIIEGKDFVELITTPEDLKNEFDFFAKQSSLPFSPVRSYTKIQQSIYDWFDKYLGFKKNNRMDIKRSRLDIQIIVLHPNNKRFFEEIIARAKNKYQPIKEKEIQAKSRLELIQEWNVPPVLYYNELYEKVNYPKHILQPAYMLKDRSSVEKDFEELLENSKNVKWWFKNGQNSKEFLGIIYQNTIENKQSTFYPDYIVMFNDGKIGIYDTKDGITANSQNTKDKASKLYNYLNTLKKMGKEANGGIVIYTNKGWFIHYGHNYTYNSSLKGWNELII